MSKRSLAGGLVLATVLLLPVTSLATGPEAIIQTGHNYLITAAAYSPDGKHVLTGSWDKTAILWDAATGRQLRTFQGMAFHVYAAVFSPDGKHVLTGTWETGTAILWDADSGNKVRTFKHHNVAGEALAF